MTTMQLRAQRKYLNKRYGRLTVVAYIPGFTHSSGRRPPYLKCLCDCGNRTTAQTGSLEAGFIASCGCLQRDRSTKHGMTDTSTYGSWSSMISRCSNLNNIKYADYGGRGIKVCDRWLGKDGFVNFLADMGIRPEGMTLDRYPSNDGNYEPGNCRWATAEEQASNRRGNHLIVFLGRSLTISQWAREYHIKPKTLFERLRRGMPIEIALSIPKGQYFFRKNLKAS